MPRKPVLVKLTVLVPAETKRALERLARTKAWSVGTYVRYLLHAHLSQAPGLLRQMEEGPAAKGAPDETR